MDQELQYAWAAGFFDGEGCVHLQCDKTRRYFCLRVVIAQLDKRPLEKFCAMFGLMENIGVVFRTRRGVRHPYWRLTISGRTASEVLKKMLPYLSLKREVVECGLELQSRIDSARNYNHLLSMSDDEIDERRLLADKAKWLNSGRWTAAENKPDGHAPDQQRVCDVPNCTDDKDAELAEMPNRLLQ